MNKTIIAIAGIAVVALVVSVILFITVFSGVERYEEPILTVEDYTVSEILPFSGEIEPELVPPAASADAPAGFQGGAPAVPVGGQISAVRAREIAVEIVGRGAATDLSLFDEDGAMVFEITVRDDNHGYMVYIDAATGDVVRMNSFAEIQNSAPEAVSAPAAPPAPATTPGSPPQQSASPSGGVQGNRPSNPAISLERAIEIAYEDLARRGINASYRSNSGMDWERGQWVWELLFRTQGERMPLIEFYINVENGSIVKFEWDD